MKNSTDSGTSISDLSLMAGKHYENFPVGSFLLPKRLRRPVHLIYAFARTADDIADEGTDSREVRLKRLEEWEIALLDAVAGNSRELFFTELAGVIADHRLSLAHFRDLVSAFRMDARGQRYQTYEELLEYCRFSANPVGRLLLELFGGYDDKAVAAADALCTALQLTNFWQDVSVDTQRERLYIPVDDLERFGCRAEDLRADVSIASVVRFEVERTKVLFDHARPLIRLAPKGLQFETALTWHGGMRILEKIEILRYETARCRPILTSGDKVLIFWRAIRERL